MKSHKFIYILISLFSIFYSSTSLAVFNCPSGVTWPVVATSCRNDGTEFMEYQQFGSSSLPVYEDDNGWCNVFYSYNYGQCIDGEEEGPDLSEPYSVPSFTCWDGTIVDDPSKCPLQTQTCWDGSIIPITSSCPPVPEVSYCEDGTIEPPQGCQPDQYTSPAQCTDDGWYWSVDGCVQSCPSGTQAGEGGLCAPKPFGTPSCEFGTSPGGQCYDPPYPNDLICPSGYIRTYDVFSKAWRCINPSPEPLNKGELPPAPPFCSLTYPDGSPRYDCRVDPRVDPLREDSCKLFPNADKCIDVGDGWGFEPLDPGQTPQPQSSPPITIDLEPQPEPETEEPTEPSTDPIDPSNPPPEYSPPAAPVPSSTDPSTPPPPSAQSPTSPSTGQPSVPSAPEVSPEVLPCGDGTCEPTPEGQFPSDYNREVTQANIANIMNKIHNLQESVKFNELKTLVDKISTIDSSTYENKYNTAVLTQQADLLISELGLQHLSIRNFHKLMQTATDLSDSRLKDIYNQIKWQGDTAQTKQNLSNNYLNQIETNTKRLVELQENPGSTTPVDMGDLSGDIGDINPDRTMVEEMEQGLKTIRQGAIDNINDSSDLDDYSDMMPDVSSFFPEMPTLSCSGDSSLTDIRWITSQGTHNINLDPCDKLAPLRQALAWIFAFYAIRAAASSIFQPKAA